MKQFKTSITIIALVFMGLTAKAQEEQSLSIVTPKWVSEKGYWVVEGNIHNKQERIIHFYNNADQKVYQQTVMGKFKLNKRKTLMHIKRMLDTAVVAWEQKRPLTENLFAVTK